MITLVFHEADRVIGEATRVLREFSAAGLLGEVAMVRIDDSGSSVAPQAVCLRAGEGTGMGLFDALAASPSVEGVVLTAVASADLASEDQRCLAECALGIADRIMQLSGVPAAASCLYVPEWRAGTDDRPAAGTVSGGDPVPTVDSRPAGGILPAEGFFSARTANLVSLPTDWRFVDGVPVGIEYSDPDRTAWHAAVEIATIASAWIGVADSRWQLEFHSPGVADNSLRFVRSAARLVTVSRSGPRAAVDGMLPVPEGFKPAPVPGLIGRTIPELHPEVFRLEGGLAGAGDPGRSGPLMVLVRALGGVFPPLASGLRGFGRVLRDEVAKALGGEAGSAERDEPAEPDPETRAGDALLVVLEGFDRRVWTDLVRNVLGTADGGGTADAAEARRAAGHKQYVFVTSDSLLDEVLDRRLAAGGSDDVPHPDDAGASEDGAGSPSGREVSEDGASRPGGPPVAGNESSVTEPTPVAPAGGAADVHDPAAEGERRGLLSLLDDAFRREAAEAVDRRRQQQREREHLAEQEAHTERFEPPAALRATIAAFVVTTFFVAASYVLLLDVFDFGDVDQILRTRLAIAATAVTWLVLRYPLAPRGDDPGVVQSHLLRAAAAVAVVAGLAAVFAEPISDTASGRPWLELIPALATLITLWLAWRVLRSEVARERPAGRALALAWAICYLVSGLLLYANMERSVFNQWGWVQRFFDDYGDGIRYAAVAVAGFLFLVSLAMFAVSDAGSDRRRRRARARIRELDRELQREELLPILRGLRTNWLGTAAALEHILRRSFPDPATTGETAGRLHSPLLRFAVRRHEAHSPPPAPGWLFAQYERAVDAYSTQRAAWTGSAGRVRPEAATMVSSLDGDPLARPGADPRWDFAHRLGAGEFDDVLAAGLAGPADWSLLDADIKFMGEVAPVAPTSLPLGLLGPGAAGLGNVAMHSTWWWPDGFAAVDALSGPRPARSVPADGGQAHLAVRLDVCDPVLEGQLRADSSPTEIPGEPPPDEGDEVLGRDDGLR